MVDSSDVEESIAGFQMNRRDFLPDEWIRGRRNGHWAALAARQNKHDTTCNCSASRGCGMTRFAVRELRMGLRELFPRVDVVLSSNETQLPEETVALKLLVEKQGSLGREKLSHQPVVEETWRLQLVVSKR